MLDGTTPRSIKQWMIKPISCDWHKAEPVTLCRVTLSVQPWLISRVHSTVAPWKTRRRHLDTLADLRAAGLQPQPSRDNGEAAGGGRGREGGWADTLSPSAAAFGPVGSLRRLLFSSSSTKSVFWVSSHLIRARTAQPSPHTRRPRPIFPPC